MKKFLLGCAVMLPVAIVLATKDVQRAANASSGYSYVHKSTDTVPGKDTSSWPKKDTSSWPKKDTSKPY